MDENRIAEKMATEFVAGARMFSSGPEDVQAAQDLADALEGIRGVSGANVNDFAKLSEGVYEVDVFVYADPMVGGRLTNTLKAAFRRLARKFDVEVRDFWSPRSDRPISEVGWMGLKSFYERNPYKLTMLVRT